MRTITFLIFLYFDSVFIYCPLYYKFDRENDQEIRKWDKQSLYSGVIAIIKANLSIYKESELKLGLVEG